MPGTPGETQDSRAVTEQRRLFDDKHQRYTPEAHNLDSELHSVMRPIMERYRDSGLSVRDICLVAILTANDIMLDFVLDLPRSV